MRGRLRDRVSSQGFTQHQGRVAQIDHLLINRWLEIWVCESKHFSEGVAINEQGEFTGFFAGRPYGVPSPLEQNRKHVAVLQAILGSNVIQLPTRLGLTLKPAIHSVILVSKGARICRPKTKLDGLDRVIKSDQLRDLIERRIDEESTATTLLSIGKVVSSETLEDLAKKIAQLHRPITFDWAGKFGLKGQGAAQAPAAQPSAVEVTQCPAERLPTPAADPKPATQEPQPILEDDLHQGRLSTSKLAAKLGIKGNSVMLERLMSAGYLARSRLRSSSLTRVATTPCRSRGIVPRALPTWSPAQPLRWMIDPRRTVSANSRAVHSSRQSWPAHSPVRRGARMMRLDREMCCSMKAPSSMDRKQVV